MVNGDGEQEDTTGLFPQLDVPAGFALEPARRGGIGICDPRMLAVAGHLAQGGWVALLEPFAVTRPGTRGFEREFRLVAIVQGG
jgi:hypothetical protein